MTQRALSLSLFLLSLALIGCEAGVDQSADEPPADQGYHDDGYLIYTGPEFDFTVTQTGDDTHFQWSVTVPTGGWEHEFHGGMYDEASHYYVVYVHLTPPASDAMVTQALVTHTGEHETQDITINEAVLAVMYTDNDTPDGELDYAKAAEWP